VTGLRPLLVKVLAVTVIAFLPGRTSEPQPTSQELLDLLDRWERRDGAAVVEVGYSLSEEFVREPEGFLEAMAKRRNEWRSWLDGLGSHSFTVFREGARPEYEALHKRMLDTAVRMTSHPKLGKLAKKLKKKLETVEIREIE
jgi:hypothetical protein